MKKRPGVIGSRKRGSGLAEITSPTTGTAGVLDWRNRGSWDDVLKYVLSHLPDDVDERDCLLCALGRIVPSSHTMAPVFSHILLLKRLLGEIQNVVRKGRAG